MNFKRVCAFIVLGFAPLIVLASSDTVHREHVFDVHPEMAVTIDVSFHQVEVTARPGTTVEVTVDLEASGSEKKVRRALNALEPVFRTEGDGVLIRSSKKGFSGFGSAKVRGRVVVTMPPDLDLTIDSSSGTTKVNGDFGSGSVLCDASSGSFHLSGAARSVDADLSSGSVFIELTRPAESVRTDTSSGSVTLRGGAREFRSDTSSGSITAKGLLGDAVMAASSGSITADWAAVSPPASIRAETSSGTVTLTLPAGTPLTGSVETSSGGIQSDFAGYPGGKADNFKFEGGPDAVQLKAETSSGSVRIRSF
jgi:DUF4097 and DUF4098 domain-containing protein YvlB